MLEHVSAQTQTTKFAFKSLSYKDFKIGDILVYIVGMHVLGHKHLE